MKDALHRFLARYLRRFRSANGLDQDPDRFSHPDAHLKTPERDPRTWKHPGASRGPFGTGGRN
ncbi:hypothetical protein [Kitasatospora sp. McL0602]|uniref:hypothetical protein n=1 Tax=Kitasatospora sp. McL0602 TaxID=3439530 RepID=UPI003F8AA7E7